MVELWGNLSAFLPPLVLLMMEQENLQTISCLWEHTNDPKFQVPIYFSHMNKQWLGVQKETTKILIQQILFLTKLSSSLSFFFRFIRRSTRETRAAVDGPQKKERLLVA